MRSRTISLIAVLASAFSAVAQEKKSPELQVLDRFVGTWDIDHTFKPAGGEEISRKVVSHRTWSVRGTFIRFEDPGLPGEPELQMLLTYDPEAKNYPGVIMYGASRSDITGIWDEKTQTMSFTGTMADGNTFESTHRFVDADHADPKGVFKNPAGAVVAELGWKQTRRDEKPLGPVPTVDELIASYHEAIGGLEANKKLTTRRLEGTVSLMGAPEPFKMTVTQKAPDLVFNEVEIPNFGVVLEGHDGKTTWKSNDIEGTVEFAGKERVQKLRDFQFHKYVDLKSDFKKLEFKGRETLMWRTCDVLAVTREDGSSETLYFDARTHLIRMVKRPELTLEMSDYQETDGVPYWRTASILTPDGNTVATINFKTVKHGVKVDEALCPAERVTSVLRRFIEERMFKDTAEKGVPGDSPRRLRLHATRGGLLHFNLMRKAMSKIKTASITGVAVLAVASAPFIWQQSKAGQLKKDIAALESERLELVKKTADAVGARSDSANLSFAASAEQPRNVQDLLEASEERIDVDELLNSMMDVMMTQDIVGMIRVILPITNLSPEEYIQLIDEIEAQKGHGPMKQEVLQMLGSFAPSDNPKESIERMMRIGVEPYAYSNLLSQWGKSDPAAALAWYREKEAKGELVGKGANSYSEGMMLGELAGGIAAKDPEQAIQLLKENLGMENLHHVISNLGKSLGERVRNGGDDAPLRELLGMFDNPEQSHQASSLVASALQTAVKPGEFDEGLEFAKRYTLALRLAETPPIH